MAHKTISIAELKVGMFVTNLDISWLQSPFLTGKKKIQNQNEIAALIKAGAKKITIDIEKSDASCLNENRPEILALESMTKAQTTIEPIQSEPGNKQELSPEEISLHIEKELSQAHKVKQEIGQISQHISRMIEENSPVQMQEIMPVIDKTISSLCRNDQALLSLLRHSKTHSKLTSHTFNVFTLSLMLATKLGLSVEEQQLLGTAALLHDSGWARLPSNLFSKGKPYTSTEKQLAAEHIKIVQKILEKSSSVPHLVSTIISQHHERIDGSGYPLSLKSNQICFLTQILMIADAYDEMLQGIGEHAGMMSSLAISNIFKQTQQHRFDEQICKAFIHAVGIYPLGSAVQLNTGEKGVVIELHREAPLLPIIKIFYNQSGNPLLKPFLCDLLKQEQNESKRKLVSVLNATNKEDDPAQILNLEPTDLFTE